jgi:hypothetical protein
LRPDLKTGRESGDERLWKLIISPEFGDQADLRRLTGDLMERMEKDLGYRSSNGLRSSITTPSIPHAHVVVRGLRTDGTGLRMSREYVQQGIRSAAEHLCTRQFGYRTELDAMEAERREISEMRFTSLDRRIMREASNPGADFGPEYFEVVRNPTEPGLSETARLRAQHEASRLAVLHRMGLAESSGGASWLVRRDCEQVLRAMQRSADRQKTLTAHGALLSDDRLPMMTLDVRDLTSIEGRILVHGEEEASGRSYLMLETTDGQVYHIHRTPEIEELRSQRRLQTNSFIRLRKLATARGPVVEIKDIGDSEAILTNKDAPSRDGARHDSKRGVHSSSMAAGADGSAAIRRPWLTPRSHLEQEKAKERERRRSRGMGR